MVALTNLFHVHAERWLLPWRVGLKFGPYVEGDLKQRFDERYDAAYSPVSLPQPGAVATQQNDRVRQIRFATALLPYFLVTPRLAIEAGYIQKYFGYDARATYAVYAGVRGLFRAALTSSAPAPLSSMSQPGLDGTTLRHTSAKREGFEPCERLWR